MRTGICGRNGLKASWPKVPDSAVVRSTSATPAPSPTIRQAVNDELASMAMTGGATPACWHCASMAWPSDVAVPSEITDSPARSALST